jgi:hypothetical protein
MPMPDQHQDLGSQNQNASSDKPRTQNIKSLDLVRWIETQSSLSYLREMAGETLAQHDSVTGQFSVKPLDPSLIQRRYAGPWSGLADLLKPSARSMRGNTYSSPRFESSCTTTANVMAASTAWDAVSTVPFIQFGLQGFFGVLSPPIAWGISIGLMVVSNLLGKLGCNRTKGSIGLANFGLLGFLFLSLIKTGLAGVGFEILVNQDGIARRYADTVALREVSKVNQNLTELLEFKDPKYTQFKGACEAAKRELSGVSRTDGKYDSLYRRTYGSIAEQDRLRPLTLDAKLELLNNSQIEGECTKQDLQLIQNQRSADELRANLDRYRSERAKLNSFEFLAKEFPSVFQQEFRIDKSRDQIFIREGGTVIGQAFEQFTSRIRRPDQISELAISLFWMAVSIVLTTLAVFFIWTLSRNKEMIMSHSNTLLSTRTNLLQAYQSALPKAQERRRESQKKGS